MHAFRDDRCCRRIKHVPVEVRAPASGGHRLCEESLHGLNYRRDGLTVAGLCITLKVVAHGRAYDGPVEKLVEFSKVNRND